MKGEMGWKPFKMNYMYIRLEETQRKVSELSEGCVLQSMMLDTSWVV